MKKKKTNKSNVFVRVTQEMREEIEKIASAEERSICSVIRQAIKQFLERRKSQNGIYEWMSREKNP